MRSSTALLLLSSSQQWLYWGTYNILFCFCLISTVLTIYFHICAQLYPHLPICYAILPYLSSQQYIVIKSPNPRHLPYYCIYTLLPFSFLFFFFSLCLHPSVLWGNRYLGLQIGNKYASGPFFFLLPLPFGIAYFWHFCDARFNKTSMVSSRAKIWFENTFQCQVGRWRVL